MILIVDDDIEGKVGNFIDDLVHSGYKCKCVGTYDEADNILNNQKQEIEAVILDFAFPVNETNLLEYDEDTKRQNGVKLLYKHEFSLYLKQIPVIINTSCEKTLREEWLKDLKHLPQEGLIIYKATSEEHLSNCTAPVRKQIIDDIKSIRDKMNITKSAEPDGTKIFEKGKSGIRDSSGHFTYREMGG